MGALEHSTNQVSVNRLALSATLHCLTGCSIGEVLGMVIASALRWDNMASVTVAAALAYAFDYLFDIAAAACRPGVQRGSLARLGAAQ